MKLLLFDIDGTLVLTGGAGVRALNRAFFEVAQVENAMDGILPHGKTDPAIIREALAALRMEGRFADTACQIIDKYVRFLAEEVRLSDRYRILPGIRHFLDSLQGRAAVVAGLATGNVERGARIKLERGNLNRYFSFGGYGSDAELRVDLVRRAAERGCHHCGQSVAPNDIFVIGDTPRDIEAGRDAGFRTIGVATSTYSRDQLRASGADLAVRDFEQDLSEILQITGLQR